MDGSGVRQRARAGDAKSIAYLQVGSGAYIAGLVDRLGIAAAIARKTTRSHTDSVSEMVARGEVITQIMTTPGVELVGPLPAEIQSYVTFAGAVAATSRAPDAGRQLLKFLATPAATTVVRSQGMEPAR